MYIGNLKIEKGDLIKTKNDCIATVIDFRYEGISCKPIVIVDKECKSQYDEKYGYDRTYYNNFWIYPAEIKDIVKE